MPSKKTTNDQPDRRPLRMDNTAVGAFRRTVIGRLRKRLDEIEAATWVEMLRQIPEYGTVPEKLREDVRGTIRTTTVWTMDVLVHPRAMTADERDVLRGIGTNRAAHGLSLRSVEGAIQAGTVVGWGFLVEEALHEAGTPASIRGLGEMAADLLRFRNEVHTEMGAGFLEGQAASLKQRIRARAEVLQDLLGGGALHNEAELVRRAKDCGIDLRPSMGLLLVAVAANGDARFLPRSEVAALVRRLPAAIEAVEHMDEPACVVLLHPCLKATSWAAVQAAAQEIAEERRLIVLTTTPVAGPLAIHKTYGQARPALTLARKLSRRPRALAFDDLTLYTLLDSADERARNRLLRQYLSPRRQSGVLVTVEGSGHVIHKEVPSGTHRIGACQAS
ncbi:MAG: PucR family transcriptional regulator [Candidatus Dormibacteria bacterium]